MKQILQLEQLLQRLATDAAKLKQQNLLQKKSHQAYFEASLFTTQSSDLTDYVNESQALLAHITQGLNNQSSTTLIEFQCTKLVEQCQAISKALSSQPLRNKNNQQDKQSKARYFANKQQKTSKNNFNWLGQGVINNTRLLYEELSKHHGYQQKLNMKIEQLNQQLAQVAMDNKLSLQQNILHQHKRLGQCNKAIYFIEKQIQQLESGKKRSY